MNVVLKPLLRLALTFAIVWFYHGLTVNLLPKPVQFVSVVVLSILTWVALSRLLFPSGRTFSSPIEREE